MGQRQAFRMAAILIFFRFPLPPIPQNHVPHRACRPMLAGAGSHTSLVELSRHGSKGEPFGDHVLYDRVDLPGEGIRRPDVRPRRLPAIKPGIPELHAPELGLRHRRLCPLGDHDPLVFSHGGEDVDREPGRLRHIDCEELHPAFHEVRNKGHRPGQPVELGDQESCPLPAAEIERPSELGAICPPAALDFGKLARELAADPGKMPGNRLTLRIQSEAGAPLPIRGNTVIGDEKRGWMRIHVGNVKRQRSLWTLDSLCAAVVSANRVAFFGEPGTIALMATNATWLSETTTNAISIKMKKRQLWQSKKARGIKMNENSIMKFGEYVKSRAMVGGSLAVIWQAYFFFSADEVSPPWVFIKTVIILSVYVIIADGVFKFVRLVARKIFRPKKTQHEPEFYAPPPAAPVAPLEDPEIVKAQKLAEIELAKAEQMARLRLAEAQGLAGIAADVAEREEARQDRQLDKLANM